MHSFAAIFFCYYMCLCVDKSIKKNKETNKANTTDLPFIFVFFNTGERDKDKWSKCTMQPNKFLLVTNDRDKYSFLFCVSVLIY